MSKEKLVKTLNREIEEINQTIDMKVIKGESYRNEARRHKLLHSMLQDMRTKVQVNKFSFSSFLF